MTGVPSIEKVYMGIHNLSNSEFTDNFGLVTDTTSITHKVPGHGGMGVTKSQKLPGMVMPV